MRWYNFFTIHTKQQIWRLAIKRQQWRSDSGSGCVEWQRPLLSSRMASLEGCSCEFNSSYNIMEGWNIKMQRALFSNISNKTNRIKLKIENEKSRILKIEEQNKPAIRTFTLAPRQELERPKDGPACKPREPKEHVRFKLERSRTLKDEGGCGAKELEVRCKQLKQPKPKLINSFSTSKFIRLHRMDSHPNDSAEQNFTQPTQNSTLGEIVEQLKNRQVLLDSGMHNYAIRKHDFQTLLLFLLSSQAFPENSKCDHFLHLKYAKFRHLAEKVKKLHCSLREEISQSLDIVALDSNVFKFEYNSQVFANDQQETFKKFINITEDIQQANRELIELRGDRVELVRLMKNMKSELSQHLKEKVDLETHIYELKDLRKELEAEVAEKQRLVSTINQEASDIFNYLNASRCRTIEKISADYKQIEREMHDYALSLQSTHMASEIAYQPRPFAEIEEVIVDEMKRINKTIIQDIEILPELKEKLMRNFILRAMEQFKSKDSEMAKVSEFKTKCIRTYIDSIKKWLENWTLKQEYLANMRKQFIYDSQRLTEKIARLKLIQAEGSTREVSHLLDEVCGLSEKIIENYKLGNSFY